MATAAYAQGIYEPGQDITGQASATVVGKRFVSVSGARDASTHLTKWATTAAGAQAHGVAAFGVSTGQPFTVLRGNSRVVTVTADNAAIAAGADVQVGANGTAITKTTGIAVGFAIDAAAANGDAQISLY